MKAISSGIFPHWELRIHLVFFRTNVLYYKSHSCFLFLLPQSQGVLEKATSSKDITQRLYDTATQQRDAISNELEPGLQRAMLNVKDVEKKTKATKQALETISE